VTPKPFLGVTKRVGEIDESVTRIELNETVSAGIKWRKLDTGMVPIFEEHTVRMERGYSLEAWYSLNPMERAIVVAQKRLENSMKNLQSEAEAKHAKKQAQKGSRKR
jgi:hypothetical protein